MPTLMQNLSFAISFASLLFAIHLFSAKAANRAPSILLGLNFLVFATQTALLGLILAGGSHTAAMIRPVTAMTIAPLAYLYFASASDPAFRFAPRQALHFLPALVIAAERIAGAYPVDIDLAIFASFGAYTIALALKATKGEAQFDHLGERKRDAYRWLIAATALLAASFAGDLGVYLELVNGARLSQSTSLLIALFADLAVIAAAIIAALRRPSPFEWMYSFGAPLKAIRRGAAPPLTDDERQDCVARFDRLIATERLHLDEGATVAAIAGKLGIPPRKLSESINRIYGESFSRRMNRLRVEEAMRLLREDSERSMYDVMLDAGFRTKSSFNREFRIIAGVAPSDYRDSLQ